MGEEQLQHRGVDHRLVGARDPGIGPHQHVEDLRGKEEAQHEHGAEGEQRLDQPRTQLDQVLHERRFGGFNVLVAHAALPASGLGSGLTSLVPTATGSSAGAVAGVAAAAVSSAAGGATWAAVAGSLTVGAAGAAGVDPDLVCASNGGRSPAAFSMSLRTSSSGSNCV